MKKYISFLLLTIFISVKMMGMHVIFHDEEDQNRIESHCKLCDFSLIHNQTPIIPTEKQEFKFEEPLKKTGYAVINSNYNFFICTSVTKDRLFYRPPPIA